MAVYMKDISIEYAYSSEFISGSMSRPLSFGIVGRSYGMELLGGGSLTAFTPSLF